MEETQQTEWTAPETVAEQTQEGMQEQEMPIEEGENTHTELEEIDFPAQLPEDEIPGQEEAPRQDESPREGGPEREKQNERRETGQEKPGQQLPAGRGGLPGRTPDFRGQVQRLLKRYPHVRSLPEEVVHACARDGRELVEAYEAHRTRQAQQAENRNLRRELAVLRQNEDARRRAPVTGVGPGGGVPIRGEDDFLRGFNSEY